MSCNCPTPNICPTTQSCLCGLNIDIYLNDLLLESSLAIGYTSISNNYFSNTQSTVWNSILGNPYELIYAYNFEQGRWEMSYFDSINDEYIVIGIYYTDNSQCPISSCDWELDCISVHFNPMGSSGAFFSWDGEYYNGKKAYSFSGGFGTYTYFRLYWVPDASIFPGSSAPLGTPAWVFLGSNNPAGVFTPISYLFNSNDCPYGDYVFEFTNPGSRMSFEDSGLTGYDMKSYPVDCGCCDETILIDLTFNDISYSDVVATIVKDEYGNTLALNGKPYYQFEIPLTPYEVSFYIYYYNTKWLIGEELEGSYYTELRTNNDCPFGFWNLLGESNITSIWVRGSECFDCCDYYTPRFSNFIKKKKYDLVDDVSAIKNKEIFGMKCGPDWSDLFKKHLILDVLHCLPYGVLCDDEEQCLINSVNENCNC